MNCMRLGAKSLLTGMATRQHTYAMPKRGWKRLAARFRNASSELLTWNCRHIANAKILPRIQGVLKDLGIPIPIICTPEELLGDDTEID